MIISIVPWIVFILKKQILAKSDFLSLYLWSEVSREVDIMFETCYRKEAEHLSSKDSDRPVHPLNLIRTSVFFSIDR